MIDQAGRIKRLEENVAIIAEYLAQGGIIQSNPEEGQSLVKNIYWDNDLQKVVVGKEGQES